VNIMTEQGNKFTRIKIDQFKGRIPTGTDLVVKEKEDRSNDTARILQGFDEVGMFDSKYIEPIYGFLRWASEAEFYDKLNKMYHI